MATVKIFDSQGSKELQCFDTLTDVPYLVEEEEIGASDDTDAPE